MAIVSKECLNNIKNLHERAKSAASYEKGYYIAQEALAAAIAQLEQLNAITSNFEVVLKEKTAKTEY